VAFPDERDGEIVVLPSRLNMRVRAYVSVVGRPKAKGGHLFGRRF
jgi:hypothetical protein